jgi:hypothetical protein
MLTFRSRLGCEVLAGQPNKALQMVAHLLGSPGIGPLVLWYIEQEGVAIEQFI